MLRSVYSKLFRRNVRGYSAVDMDGVCKVCDKSVLFIKEAIYEGFTKTGEALKCSSCGAMQEPCEAGDAVSADVPGIFSDEDRSPAINLFADGENKTICRYCVHYVVNPFTQRCGLHEREIEATDTCFDFTVSGADEEDAES